MQSLERKSPALPKSLSSYISKRFCEVLRCALSEFRGVVLDSNKCLFASKVSNISCVGLRERERERVVAQARAEALLQGRLCHYLYGFASSKPF